MLKLKIIVLVFWSVFVIGTLAFMQFSTVIGQTEKSVLKTGAKIKLKPDLSLVESFDKAIQQRF